MSAPTIVGLKLHFATTADAITGHHVIDYIRWVKPAVSQNDLAITNTATDEIAAASCPTTLDDQVIQMNGMHTEGIICTFDGGTVDVYLKAGY